VDDDRVFGFFTAAVRPHAIINRDVAANMMQAA